VSAFDADAPRRRVPQERGERLVEAAGRDLHAKQVLEIRLRGEQRPCRGGVPEIDDERAGAGRDDYYNAHFAKKITTKQSLSIHICIGSVPKPTRNRHPNFGSAYILRDNGSWAEYLIFWILHRFI
jgi:hypothetical protein